MNELAVRFTNYSVCLFIVVLFVRFSIIASLQPNGCPHTAAAFSYMGVIHAITSWQLCHLCPLQNHGLLQELSLSQQCELESKLNTSVNPAIAQ